MLHRCMNVTSRFFELLIRGVLFHTTTLITQYKFVRDDSTEIRGHSSFGQLSLSERCVSFLLSQYATVVREP